MEYEGRPQDAPSRETRYLDRLLSAARRWHDPVHPEIFDDLAVVIERVSWGKGGQEQTSSGGLVIPDDRLHQVRVVQRGSSLVAKCEGILQVLNDVGFGCHIVRTFAVVNRLGAFLAGDR